MSSPAQLWVRTKKQRQHRNDDAMLIGSGNARSEQLLVVSTELLTNREWLPGELLSRLEHRRSGWFLDIKYQKNVQMYSCTNMLPWIIKIFEAVLFLKSAHVSWWNYTNVLCSVQNVYSPTTSNQHPLLSSAAVRCVTRDLLDTWSTPSSVWVSLYITSLFMQI